MCLCIFETESEVVVWGCSIKDFARFHKIYRRIPVIEFYLSKQDWGSNIAKNRSPLQKFPCEFHKIFHGRFLQITSRLLLQVPICACVLLCTKRLLFNKKPILKLGITRSPTIRLSILLNYILLQ